MRASYARQRSTGGPVYNRHFYIALASYARQRSQSRNSPGINWHLRMQSISFLDNFFLDVFLFPFLTMETSLDPLDPRIETREVLVRLEPFTKSE